MSTARTFLQFKSLWPVLVAGSAFLFVFGMSASPADAGPNLDPEKVMGPDACAECHKDTHALWQETHHFKTFRSMPRSDEASAIADKMGIKRVKKESVCLTCHFTTRMKGDKEKPIAGISCESCHGAAKDWIKTHADYGGASVNRESEAPDHRMERIAASEAAGMIRPERLYALAENCFQCHTVPLEELVNVGGHPAGSNFELVSWSQGEVRHNVWFSGGQGNPEASAERKRMMYVVGRALDLEYALRGVAISTENATYAKTMAKRAALAKNHLAKVIELVSIPEVEEMLTAADGVELKLNNEAALLEAADRVASATQAFVMSADGGALAAIDGLIPSPDQYKGAAGM